jgi:hypothetical protein
MVAAQTRTVPRLTTSQLLLACAFLSFIIQLNHIAKPNPPISIFALAPSISPLFANDSFIGKFDVVAAELPSLDIELSNDMAINAISSKSQRLAGQQSPLSRLTDPLDQHRAAHDVMREPDPDADEVTVVSIRHPSSAQGMSMNKHEHLFATEAVEIAQSGSTHTHPLLGNGQLRPTTKDLIVFVHVPKTGGSSFYDTLRWLTAKKIAWYPELNGGSASFTDTGCGLKIGASHCDFSELEACLTTRYTGTIAWLLFCSRRQRSGSAVSLALGTMPKQFSPFVPPDSGTSGRRRLYVTVLRHPVRLAITLARPEPFFLKFKLTTV